MQDLTTFRVALSAILGQAQRGAVDSSLAIEIHDMGRAIVNELQQRRQRDPKWHKAYEVQRLESMMRDYSAGDRERIICQRLKISRATYHRRRVSQRIETNGISNQSNSACRAPKD